MKYILNIAAALVLLGSMSAAAADKKSAPAHSFVPDEQTAISVALAVWTPIYGAENIERQKPYVATLKNGQWRVQGSMPDGQTLGGVAHITINKADGKILQVSHGK